MGDYFDAEYPRSGYVEIAAVKTPLLDTPVNSHIINFWWPVIEGQFSRDRVYCLTQIRKKRDRWFAVTQSGQRTNGLNRNFVNDAACRP